MAKSVTTEYRLELSSMLILLFGFVTIVGIVGVFFNDKLPTYLAFLRDLTDPFGTWAYWLVVVGPLGLIVAGWALYDFLKKVKKLRTMMKSPGKAKFVRNLDDIEYLAWSLPQRYEDEVLERKKEFGL